MAWLHLTCHHYCRPTNLGGLYDLRVNISWRHLVIAWKVLASVVLRMPPLLFGIRFPSPSSVPSPFSRAIWRPICLISHIHNCDVTFLSYYVYFPSFCLVSVWYHKRLWAWWRVAVEIGAIENWHYYYSLLLLLLLLMCLYSFYLCKAGYSYPEDMTVGLKEREILAQKGQQLLYRISPSYLNTFHCDQKAWILINQHSYLEMAGYLTAAWVPPLPLHHGMFMTSCGPIFIQPNQWKHKEI